MRIKNNNKSLKRPEQRAGIIKCDFKVALSIELKTTSSPFSPICRFSFRMFCHFIPGNSFYWSRDFQPNMHNSEIELYPKFNISVPLDTGSLNADGSNIYVAANFFDNLSSLFK